MTIDFNFGSDAFAEPPSTFTLDGNYYYGLLATSSDTGYAVYLNARVRKFNRTGGSSCNVKCALYRASDGVLMGVTDSKVVTIADPDFPVVFTFTTNVPVVNGTAYYITIVGDQTIFMWGQNDIDIDALYISGTYATAFDDPITWDYIGAFDFACALNVDCSYTAPFTGTNFQINIGDAWKAISAMQINIGDVWKNVTSASVNIGDSWKTIF